MGPSRKMPIEGRKGRATENSGSAAVMFLVGTRPLRRTLAAASWQNHITDEDRSSLGTQRLPSGIRDDRAHATLEAA